jgi:Flp pilus assembly protein protease CpaA
MHPIFPVFPKYVYDYIFIAGIIIVGAITSYSDFRYGKIKNRVIIFGIAYAVLMNVFLFFSLEKVNPVAYAHYAVNSLFMLVLGFILWNIGLWTAGDAKLFFVFNLLTLPNFIQNYYLGFFYGLVYFVNIFGILLLYFTYKTIQKVSRQEFIYSVKSTFKPRLFFVSMLFVFAFGFLYRFFPASLSSNFFLTIIVTFIVYSIIEVFFRKSMFYLFLAVAVLRVIIDNKHFFDYGFWLSLLVSTFVFVMLVFFVQRICYFAFTRKTKLKDLKEGMFIAEDIIPVKIVELNEETKMQMENKNDSGIRYRKKRIENLTFFAYLKNSSFASFPYNKNLGLNTENLKWLGSNKEKLMFRSIRVYDTMPFAPIIFAGVLATIIVKGNLFVAARIIFKSLFGF